MFIARKLRLVRLGLLALGVLVPTVLAQTPPPAAALAPPVAPRVPKVLEFAGTRRADDYDWMRDKADPRLAAYLEAENAYAAAVMKPTEALQARIFAEISSRLVPDERTLPFEENGYLYFTRFEKGKEYPIYCRRKVASKAADEVMLDANQQAAGHALYKSSQPVVSPDNRLIAFAADTSGNRLHEIRFTDLAAGALLPDVLRGTAGEIVWAADSRSILYSTPDASIRTYRAVRHVLGTPVETDAVIFQEDDPLFELTLSRSKSRTYALIDTSSETTSECRIVDLADPGAKPIIFQPRTPGLRYWVQHGGGTFFIRTDRDARDFSLMQAAPGKTGVRDWTPVVPAEPGVLLDDFDVFKGFVVLQERVKGLPRLRIVRLAGGPQRLVDFPDASYDAELDPTPEYASRTFRVRYSSPSAPTTIYEVELATGARKALKRDEVGGGFDPSRYVVRRLAAPAPDGALVPITVVMRKDLRLDGTNPLLLSGYGAYGSTSSSCRATFQPERLSLLDRGFVVAIAHVRGGSDLGRAWYEDGKLLHKRNTYSDFIACAEYLVKQRYTSPATMFANGLSAGGMLMAVVANWRPDLFKGIIAEVPWTDVVTDSLDPSLPLVTVEYEEWGNPSRKADLDYLLSYSPYDNVKAQAYPALLVTGAFNDTQVMVWNPAKWVAKLRALKTDHNPLLLVTNMASGHSGASGRTERFKLTALKYAFMLHLLGRSN
jgi:oligopeptidase B